MARRQMVELPKYVTRVTARGRDYYYFQKGRGTPRPDSRHRLPGHPHELEFWAAYRKLAGETERGTFRDLIVAYRTSPEFARLADSTRRDYTRYLEIIQQSWGSLFVDGLRPVHVLALRDKWAETPSTANHLLSILSTLISWGIPREYCSDNPCGHIQRFTSTGGCRPWPDWAFPLAIAHAREDIARAIWLGLHTGQRMADIINMSWRDIERGPPDGINVTQNKTSKHLWIPLHTDLAAEMSSWERRAPWQLVLPPHGRPYNTDRFRAAWGRFMSRMPAGRIRAEGFTFHGLRASSVAKLREAGCETTEIQSITGMSLAMVTRYSRFADQKKLATAAIERLETRTHRDRNCKT